MDAKEAVKIAVDFVQDTFRETEYNDLTLEEIEFDDENNIWNVTLGLIREQNPLLMLSGGHGQHQRDYKIFKIDNDTGIVKSMRFRNPSQQPQ